MGKRNPVLVFIKNLIQRFNEDQVFNLASQLAYTFLFSLFPFLIFLFSLLPYVGLTPDMVTSFLKEYAPPELISMIHKNFHQVLERNGGLLSFGVIATFWPMASAIMTIRSVLNRAYGVKETRSFFIMWGMVFLFTIGILAVIIIALILNVFGPVIGRMVFDALNISHSVLHLWTIFRIVISSIVIYLVFGCLYFVSPSKHLNLRDVSIGAAVAALGWELASFLFSSFIERYMNYTYTYGTLAGVIVIMTWFYLTGLILLLGGEINVVLHKSRELKNRTTQQI